jgi:hypothetical protein
VDSPDQQATLAGQLVANAARDLTAYADVANPNRLLAGRAAVCEIDAAITVLRLARAALAAELHDGQPPTVQATPLRHVNANANGGCW